MMISDVRLSEEGTYSCLKFPGDGAVTEWNLQVIGKHMFP